MSDKLKAAREWLKKKGTVSKSKIAEKYGISTRTLGRAIDSLSTEKHQPVNTKQPSNDDVKIEAAKYWLESTDLTKTDVAKRFGISTRSLNRGLDALDAGGASSKKEKANASPAKQDSPVYNFTGTRDSITISNGKETAFVPKDDPRYENIVELVLAGDLETAWNRAHVKSGISRLTEGLVTIENGKVKIQGTVVENDMSARILNLLTQTSDETEIRKFVRFFESLMDSPDKRVVDELFLFLENISIELNEDGSFFAYRAVNHNFTDKRTGEFDNSVGAVVTMPRSMVNDNKHQTCSAGLHFASYEYASDVYGGYGDQLIKVKIFPRDVVSIPVDYNSQKGRCCRFEVVEHVKTL